MLRIKTLKYEDWKISKTNSRWQIKKTYSLNCSKLFTFKLWGYNIRPSFGY